MSHNPLLGSRISLISKKNIRYEGTLYSINESDATVALQNVRAYGTEGREVEEEGSAFVAPQDQVHPYLLFRGCDIKDLHVHEQVSTTTGDSSPEVEESKTKAEAKAADTEESESSDSTQKAAAVTTDVPEVTTQETDEKPPPSSSPVGKEDVTAPSNATETATEAKKSETTREDKKKPLTVSKGEGNANHNKPKSSNSNRRNRNKRNNNPKQMVGSGASLLNRKARGVVEGRNEDLKKDFDFESNLAEFSKTNAEESDSDVADTEEATSPTAAYSKDDFFDSISNDATDRASGIDHRIRGKEERNLNTETFGATSLGNNRRYRRRGGRGGNGRGRGRGRGQGGRGRGGRGGRGRQYGDGGIAAASGNQAQPAW